MFAPLEKPTAIGGARPARRPRAAASTKSASSWVRVRRSSRSNTPSASRRKKRGMPFSSTLPAGAQPRRAREQRLAERQEVVLVAAGAVQQQQHRRVRRAGDEPMDEAEVGGRASSLRRLRRAGGGAAAGDRSSRSRIGLVHRAGSLSAVPSSAGLSSTVKPGPSVAISNSTPPGSRK